MFIEILAQKTLFVYHKTLKKTINKGMVSTLHLHSKYYIHTYTCIYIYIYIKRVVKKKAKHHSEYISWQILNVSEKRYNSKLLESMNLWLVTINGILLNYLKSPPRRVSCLYVNYLKSIPPTYLFHQSAGFIIILSVLMYLSSRQFSDNLLHL